MNKYLILAIVIVLLLVAGGYYVFTQRQSGPNKLTSMEKTPTAQYEEYKGKYFSFRYPKDWELYEENDNLVSLEASRSVGDEKSPVPILEFTIALDNSAQTQDLEKYLMTETATVSKVLSKKDIVIESSMKNAGIEIVGEQGEDTVAGGESTIILRAVRYDLKRPIPNFRSTGVGRDSIMVSGYFAGTLNGKDVLTNTERQGLDDFFRSIADVQQSQ